MCEDAISISLRVSEFLATQFVRWYHGYEENLYGCSNKNGSQYDLEFGFDQETYWLLIFDIFFCFCIHRSNSKTE